ncbi:MAG: sugar ABC transporter ATP-binding protein [Chryseolinea sp.]
MRTIELQGISKTFPGVKALQGIDMLIHPGEIHAVCGENGAGKSTMMNILAGNLQPDAGRISINDQIVSLQSPQEAFEHGISIVHQHLSLVESLSIAENIFANQQPTNRFGFIQYKLLRQKTKVLLDQLDIQLDPTTTLSELSYAEKQMVEIAKALSKNPELFILDEPTASISAKETKILFNILKNLKQKGVAILYISHRLDEIFQIADRISILKDGKPQGTFPVAEISKELLIQKMVGRTLEETSDQSHRTGEVLLDVKNLSGEKFTNISFTLHCGEIIGLAGLIGAGRTEIARAIFGVEGKKGGEIIFKNESIVFDHPEEAIERGVAYVPEDRKHLGLFMDMSIRDNIIAASLKNARDGNLFSSAKATNMASSSKQSLNIATTGVDQIVRNLSGGNQQKVVLGKWLLTNPDVLIVDEPTHGIDVGARHEIYKILSKLASQGKGIIVISSDMAELLRLCDNIIVLKEGSKAGTLSRQDATEQKIMSLAAN